MSSILRIFTVIALALIGTVAVTEGVRADADDKKSFEDAVKKLRVVRPDLPIVGVTASPVANLLEVELDGGAVLYATKDGNHLIVGDMYRVTDTQLVNISEEKRVVYRRELMAAVDLEDMVIFAPEQTLAVVNVFTDVDCTFCRRLHQEIAEYNALGIEVRYLAYPRAGVGSESYDKIVSAWCSKDPRDAITALKSGADISPKKCANPVAKQYELGKTVGISGTPAIVSAGGELWPGYIPPKDLAERLGI